MFFSVFSPSNFTVRFFPSEVRHTFFPEFIFAAPWMNVRILINSNFSYFIVNIQKSSFPIGKNACRTLPRFLTHPLSMRPPPLATPLPQTPRPLSRNQRFCPVCAILSQRLHSQSAFCLANTKKIQPTDPVF